MVLSLKKWRSANVHCSLLHKIQAQLSPFLSRGILRAAPYDQIPTPSSYWCVADATGYTKCLGYYLEASPTTSRYCVYLFDLALKHLYTYMRWDQYTGRVSSFRFHGRGLSGDDIAHTCNHSYQILLHFVTAKSSMLAQKVKDVRFCFTIQEGGEPCQNAH